MVNRGNYLLRALQGYGIDHLVRESIQNSLDASIDGFDPDHEVHVDFTFVAKDRNSVTGLFDDTTATRLNARFSKAEECSILAIRDTGTTGLTGSYDDDTSNIYKLVRDFGRAQQNQGAGGSWGVGKTVFYNFGAGIVGYYSRTEDDGERLVFSCIEDELRASRDQRITPSDTGIAWWLGEGDQPISGSREIERLLNELGLTPLEDGETGTVIIIPFFGQARMLLPDGGEGAPPYPWEQAVESYVKLTIQRWYANRLIKTEGKCRLVASVNSVRLDPKSCEPVFGAMQSLRRLIDGHRNDGNIKDGISLNLVTTEEGETKFEPCDAEERKHAYIKAIRPKGIIQKGQPAGWLAAIRLSKRELGMTPPDNRPSPHEYIFGSREEVDQRLPIVAMCRGPQMIVAYDVGEWRRGLTLDDEDEFVLALFQLNSEAITKSGLSLEEYIRGIENPKHDDWDDSSGPINIPNRIKSNVRKALKEAFSSDTNNLEASETGEAIRAKLGKSLLPDDFGKSATAGVPVGGGGGGDGGGGGRRKSSRQKLEIERVTYGDGKIEISLIIHAGKEPDKNPAMLSVAADSGSAKPLDKRKWDRDEALKGLSFPFTVEDFEVSETTFLQKRAEKKPQFGSINKAGSFVACSIDDKTAKMYLIFKPIVVQLKAKLTLKTTDRMVRPVLSMEPNKGVKKS